MRGLAILLAFQLAGWALHEFARIPLPANVLGFFLLTAALLSGLVKMVWIEETAEWLLSHMTLFFVPFVVSTMTFFPVLINQALPILASMVLSTWVVLWATARTTQHLNRKERIRRGTVE
ncbi:MAG: hypothetical protein BAA01_07230 [Bacillus thermozeamaize]|uniref:CidA/LrgA family protein n=1 Tax=Bacillus thermozeamaize TaxID=230954 RepID=A0A1Y3PUQ5_9BACI|nr:MAG: hypothetical protein BAA01_07230 [Bacillus thermozeamaize]